MTLPIYKSHGIPTGSKSDNLVIVIIIIIIVIMWKAWDYRFAIASGVLKGYLDGADRRLLGPPSG